jgi:hypothetical protein
MDLGEPPVLPVLRLPDAPQLPRPVLEVPRATLPSYKPLVVPPNDLRPPPGIKSTEPSQRRSEPQPKKPPVTPPIPAQVRYIDVPGTELEVPLPSNEILVTAGTTATVSVVATLTATAIFKRTVQVLKPIIKKLLTRKSKNGEAQ